MLKIEKKIYAFIDKYLHFIIAIVICGVVLFMNRQVLHCVRPYEGADMWEASGVFVHSPLYILFIRKIWIELFSGDYVLYHVVFGLFTYTVALLGAILLYRHQQKTTSKNSLLTATIFFCIASITPLALLYGPIMSHTDGIAMTMILLGFLISTCLRGNLKWLPFILGLTFAVSLQSNYIFFAIAMVIYGLIQKRKTMIYIPPISILLSIFLNLLLGVSMEFSAIESLQKAFRFFYISQATGTYFSSIASWVSYMIFWNGYWLGMICLFMAFISSTKRVLYTFFHIALFFFSVTIFLNGYIL